VTVRFCDRYIPKRSRTHDQMVQAARSGVQNIAEGSQASGTSKKFELKLTSVARASLEELRLDYEDFLRQGGFPEWEPADPRRRELVARRCTTAAAVAEWVGEVWARERVGEGRGENGLYGLDGQPQPQTGAGSMPPLESTPPPPSRRSTHRELAANAALVLIGVACVLLDRQLESLAAAFTREGGFTERLYRVRRQHRG
jgi:four helix bundle suffix protein